MRRCEIAAAPARIVKGELLNVPPWETASGERESNLKYATQQVRPKGVQLVLPSSKTAADRRGEYEHGHDGLLAAKRAERKPAAEELAHRRQVRVDLPTKEREDCTSACQ